MIFVGSSFILTVGGHYMKKYSLGTVISRKYRVVSAPIESGGCYVVYKVHHLGWGLNIAMKIPTDEILEDECALSDIYRECELWTGLGANPYINSCYYVGKINGVPAVFSEWAEGCSLDAYIGSGKLYEGDDTEIQLRILDIAIQILYALGFAHSQKPPVVHADVKPLNIIVSDECDVKLTDFGLSASSSGRYTEGFCSPEQKDGGRLTEASDIYSWAVTVLTMYCGKAAWKDGIEAGKCIDELFCSCKIDPPEEIKAILRDCLDQSAQGRPNARSAFNFLIKQYDKIAPDGQKYERVYFSGSDKADEAADHLNNRALCCLDNNETDKAVEYWETALEIVPDHLTSTYNYGVYCIKEGRMTVSELCGKLRRFGKAECVGFIRDIERKFTLRLHGSIDIYPESIMFNSKCDKLLCVDDKVKIFDVGSCSLIEEYDRLDDLPDTDKWIRSESHPNKDFAVRSGNICSQLYKYRCCIYDFEDHADCTLFCFSSDGAWFAVEEDKSIKLFRMPLSLSCKPAFNKTASCEELIEYRREYDNSCAKLTKAMTYCNYPAAVSALEEIGQIPYYGKSTFYFRQKKEVAVHCQKTASSVIRVKKENIRLSHVAFSPDSDYFAVVSGNKIMVFTSEDMYCTNSIVITPDIKISRIRFNDNDSRLFVFPESDFDEPLSIDLTLGKIEKRRNANDKGTSGFHGAAGGNPSPDIAALLPKDAEICVSPDGFSAVTWDDSSCSLYRVDHKLKYISKTPFPSPVLTSDKACIFGACDNNAFLFDLLTDEQLEHIKALSEITLQNPSIRFSNEAKKAKEYLDTFGDNAPSHSDPRIRYMIECSDEEYEELMNDCKRQSAYWDNKSYCSFMSLYIRSMQQTSSKADNAPQTVKAEEKIEIESLPHASAKNLRRNELTQMAERIHNMREVLLKTVLGQNHAVHTVAEGLFNAEVLAAADTDRKRPRAIFTFAGPPGVGKTLLAETAAEQLGIPFKRFDMSEYSDEHAFEGLFGFDYIWKNSSPGKLTTFVKEYPHCILLFDEFEKSHQKTIQIFYQLLDAGVVTDRYFETRRIAAQNNALRSEDEKITASALNTNPHISFKDTIIIFTTNACRSLYENNPLVNNSAVAPKTVLNALETEIDPLTNSPYFPKAIVSRIATGYTLLFNQLMPHHLVGIIEKEYSRFRELIQKQYNINVSADSNVLLSILYSAGGCGDARSVSAIAANFFRNEFYKLVNYRFDTLENINNIYFRAYTKKLPKNIAPLFGTREKTEILIYGSELTIKKISEGLSGYVIHGASRVDEAVALVSEKNISFTVIDISHRSDDGTGLESDTDSARTIGSSIAAKTWHDGKRLFGRISEMFPEMPVYLLETPQRVIDNELLSGFERLGARGKIAMLSDNAEALTKQIDEISHELYMQNIAADMAKQHKALTFETAPKRLDNDLFIDICGFELERVVDADDMDDLLADAEKPKERFDDIIGAGEAKKELRHFVDYLKNPRKYAAQGHRLPKGVLLYGKPGTGKTMLAKALAGESDITFIPAAASSFVNEFTGSGPAAVRELFKKARRYAPSIIFIDEVDAVARQRKGNGFNTAEEETLNALLVEIDGFSVDPNRPVFVLAATNFEIEKGRDGIGVLDEAFVRRFDNKIRIELPNKEERRQLMEMLVSKISKHDISEAAIESIAARSLGMSPAMIANVVEAAKRTAFDSQSLVNDRMLEEAFEKTKFGEKEDRNEQYLLRVARHETGHAIINYLSGNTPEYITIEARSGQGGYMEFSEEQRSMKLFTKKQLIDRIRVDLGGRAAEILYYGEEEGISTGPSGDLENATDTALAMLIYYGMDKEFGLAAIDRKTALGSPDIRKKVNEILEEEMSNSIAILKENKHLADALIDELLRKNRLTASELEELLKNVRSAVKQ